MNQKRRMMAWMLSIAMLLGPFGARADSADVASNGEANRKPAAETAANSEETDPPAGTPEGTQTGAPEGTQTGTPEGTQTGTPEGTQTGTPEGNPAGTPEGTPAGSPEGTQTGTPEGTPAGSPEGTPAGTPEGTPAGSPEGTPAGTPEGTPAGAPEGTPAGAPEGTPAGSPEGTPAGTPEGTPEGAPEGTPAGTPEGTPTGSPEGTPKPPQTPEGFEPQGEAWTELEDGRLLDGTLQEILDELQQSGAKATLYIRTKDAVRVAGIDVSLFDEKVTLALSEEAFGEEISLYEIKITVALSEQRGLPDLIIQAVRRDAEPTGEPTQSPGESQPPEPTPSIEPTPSPTPAVTLTVSPQGYREGEWCTEVPVFNLSGIEKGSKDYVYGVFYCNERLILLEQDADAYTLQEQGEVSLRFAILDMMGDIVALSEQYDVRVDTCPPSGPYIEQDFDSDTIAWLNISDGESGIEAISYDFGKTWEAYDPVFEPYSIMGEKGETIEAGKIVVRDRAGHTSSNGGFTFGRKINGLLPSGGGGSGSGKPPVRHVKETMDYSLANYNALELEFPRDPVSELVAGDTPLSLTLIQEETEEGEAGLFTARLDTWRPDEQTTLEEPNALVLSAENSEGMNTWSFTGDVYKLLYNSGIDYLVMTSGEYMTAIPTAGFTGGTQYAKLKASGVSTRKFAYTLCQDEALRETTMSVTVEGETYLLGEERDQPMYRYDVLVGTKDMMRRPYESYMPGNQTAESQAALSGGADTAKADEP